MFKRQVLQECISALLILLFVYASLSKFLDFKGFQHDLDIQPFPNSWTPYLMWIIPCTEIGISVSLIFERTRMLGFIASFVLMVLFTIYTSIILLHFFPYIPCSCGGVIKRLTWQQHLVFNLFFVALSVTGTLIQRRKRLDQILTSKNKNSFV